MSAKNILQELCQKHGWKAPFYTSMCQGPPHRPSWGTTLCLYPPNISQCISFNGEDQPTKKLAEQDAASKALSLFFTQSIEPTMTLKFTKKTILLVDVENLPKFIGQLPPYEGPLEIWAFVGKHHHLASQEYDDSVTVVHSPSTRLDGTDSCLQICVGMLLGEDRHEMYLIATRDHFGGSVVDMITSKELPWQAKQAHLVSSVDHLIELFGTLV